jgi:hypothetical protein
MFLSIQSTYDKNLVSVLNWIVERVVIDIKFP